MPDDLTKLKLAELREMARVRGIKPVFGVNKAQLIEKLQALDAEKKQSDPPKPQPKAKAEPGKSRKPVQDTTQEPAKAPKPVRRMPEPKQSLPPAPKPKAELHEDNVQTVAGSIFVSIDGFGFIDCVSENSQDKRSAYIPKSFVQDFNLKTGDYVKGYIRKPRGTEKNPTLTAIIEAKSKQPDKTPDEPAPVGQKIVAASAVPTLPAPKNTVSFESLTPIFPNSRLRLETANGPAAMRIMDLVCPVGKGQRGLIVAPPKAGKTTLLKEIAAAVIKNHPEECIMVLLIDERPEEVTDFKESVTSANTEVFYSTFDELPEHHIAVAETVLNQAKKLVSNGKDVLILLDSITRLVRANNLKVDPSGRTLSGGLDPAALPFPKKFLGAARNIRDGGSLTIIATALVETGSRMDDVVYEEFKGTGNMEVVLDRRLAERRVFPAIDISRSGTRRDDLLLDAEEQKAVQMIHRSINGSRADEATEQMISFMKQTKTNADAVQLILKARKLPETTAARRMPVAAVRNYQTLQEMEKR